MEEQQIVEAAMSGIELISLVASIASLILAVGAIWLSIVFFRMSTQASQATTEAAKGIDASVQRLEKLFDKLYSDTFSMMKDTVTDMRKHIWSKPSSDRSEISESVKKEIDRQIQTVLQEANIADEGKQKEIQEKFEKAFSEVLIKSRDKKRAIKTERVMNAIREHAPVSVERLAKILHVDDTELALHHLFMLREADEITWDGPSNKLDSDTIIELPSEDEE